MNIKVKMESRSRIIICCLILLLVVIGQNHVSCFRVIGVSEPIIRQRPPTNIRVFGCAFLNLEDYSVNFNGDRTMAVYGAEIAPVEISETSMAQFIRRVRRLTRNVLQMELLDYWAPYIELYIRYAAYASDEVDPNLFSFFSNTTIRFQDGTSDYSQILKLFKHYVTQYQRYRSKLFLVPAIVGVDNDMLEQYLREGSLPQSLFEHVAGVFPFKLNGQEGYTVMDPAFGLPKPVVVFTDGSISEDFPNTASTSQLNPAGDTVEMRYVESSTLKLIVAEIKDESGEIIHRNVYSVRAPYCSFMEHTAKLQALKTTGLIIARRDRRGLPIAMVSVDLLPRPHDLTFKIDIYSEPSASARIAFDIFDTVDMTETQLIERVDSIINLPNNETLLDRMRVLTILSNNNYLTQVKQLYENLTGRELTPTIE